MVIERLLSLSNWNMKIFAEIRDMMSEKSAHMVMLQVHDTMEKEPLLKK